jgi:prepilin-type N-terminal cleavage/methylation domain-containing protein
MMRESRRYGGTRRWRRGFSLVEVMIVLAIGAIVATMGFGYLLAAQPESQLQRGEIFLTSFFDRARNLAISQETSTRVIFNEETGEFWIEQLNRATASWNTVSEIATLPEGVGIQPESITFAGDTVQFTARGSLMAGGSITLINSTGSTSVFTGQVASGRFPITAGSLR